MEGKTPVTILQELLLKRKVVPTYNLILDGGGTHEPIFKYEVSAAGQTAVGSGKSKKEAKHHAANELLQVMKRTDASVQSVSDEVSSPYEGVLKENAVGELNDFCTNYQLRLPEYKLTRDEGLPHAKVFSWSCTVSSFTTEATARTKKNAKQMAAQDMLLKLKDCLSDIIELRSANTSPNTSPQRHSEAEMDSAVGLAIKKLPRHIKRVNTTDKLGVNLGEICFSLKEENLPDVPYLDELTGRSDSWFDAQYKEAFKEMLSKITQEMQCDFQVREMETIDPKEKAVVLTINSTPAWTFVSIGPTVRDACNAAYENGVRFLVKMRI